MKTRKKPTENRRPRVVFDMDAVLRNRYSGFYTFGRGFLKGINALDSKPEMVLLYQKKFHDRAMEIMRSLDEWAHPRPSGLKFRWLQSVWDIISYPPLRFIAGQHDLYHCFHNFMPPRRLRSPSILTVHDLRRYVLPELYASSRLDRFEKAVARADHFIAVSHSTKKDITTFFGVPEDRIDVVHLACDASPEKMDRLRENGPCPEIEKLLAPRHEKYLVALSSKDKRKNIKRIANAFLAAIEQAQLSNIALVILGRLPKEIELPHNENIITAGEVEDIMSWLAFSSGLVFASLYEGFGLPVLEGFAAGVPVITSDISSMPEVSGNAAILVNPRDIREIRDAIVLLLSDRNIADDKIQEGRNRLKHFSWKKTAGKTVDIYRKILSKDTGAL